MTNLRRRLRKLDALLSDPSGLVPYSEKWLDYWQNWLDRWADDPEFQAARTDATRSRTRDHQACA